MQSAIRTFTVVAVLIGGVAACKTTPRLKGRDVEVVSQGRLEALNPNEIAVMPIQTAAPGIQPPLKALRRAAATGLVRRRYTPIRNGLVDEHLASASTGAIGPREASYSPGDLAEDAVLEVTVSRWDQSNWEIRRVLDVGMEARMIDPADPLGPPLWAARIQKEFRFPAQGAIGDSSDRAMENACSSIFSELFYQLPPRDTSGDTSLLEDPIPADG